jgi:hypothetical protein
VKDGRRVSSCSSERPTRAPGVLVGTPEGAILHVPQPPDKTRGRGGPALLGKSSEALRRPTTSIEPNTTAIT